MFGLSKVSKRKTLMAALSVIVLGLMVAEPAFAGGDLFDRAAVITGKMPVIKTFLIYIFFLLGVGAIGWAGMEMLKLSKPETRGEATWTGVLIKAIAGTVLIGVTLSSDVMQRTIFGGSSAAPTGLSSYEAPDLNKRA